MGTALSRVGHHQAEHRMEDRVDRDSREADREEILQAFLIIRQ